MRISVPTEVKNNEFRVALTPAGVHDLVAQGHEVFVQAGAGEGSSMTDTEYADAGATLLDDPAEVWARASCCSPTCTWRRTARSPTRSRPAGSPRSPT